MDGIKKNTLKEKLIQDKKNDFIKRTINHPILHNVFIDLIDEIEESKAGRVLHVFGPTGVGKSTLCKRVKYEIIKNNQLELEKDKGLIPVVSMELPSPDNGKFNWKDFYRRFLKEMHEPLIDYKKPNSQKEKKRIPNHLPSTSPQLRESMENAIIYRKTRIVLLDEAQHLLKVASGKAILDQMDAIKSIANLTEAIFVMFGTYELMDFFDLNGQLCRRTEEFHFRRYNLKNKTDIREFTNVLNTLHTHLPLEGNIKLTDYWEFLYERSVGCIGILKDWIDLCLAEALKEDNNTISFELLKKYAPHPSKAFKVAEEAIKGERDVNKRDERRSELQSLLGLSHIYEEKVEYKGINSGSLKRDVGKRTPTRDEIGIAKDGS